MDDAGRATASDLFTWLTTLYPVWGQLSVEDTAAAALVGLGELALSGATTVSDHHYVVPHGEDTVFDAIAAAARTVGVRLLLCRGSMDLGESAGGLPPDSIVESIDAILASTETVAARLHDGERVMIAVAPCSPFSVSTDLMVESAALGASLGPTPAHPSRRNRGRGASLSRALWQAPARAHGGARLAG